MKRIAIMALVMLMAMAAAAYGKDVAPQADLTKSLTKISARVQAALTQERIHSMFDFFRKMSGYGVTYQPALVAPNGLVSKLDKEHLRLYAGVKLFDAIYAATFLKRAEVADCVKTLEEIQKALDLRSHADLRNAMLKTLKKAAAEPESVDIQKLIKQLAGDYVSEVPALMSNAESAEYLIDGLYGFEIEMIYVVQHLEQADSSKRVLEGLDRIASRDGFRLILDLFEAFDRKDKPIHAGGKTFKRVPIIRTMYDLDTAAEAGKMAAEEENRKWDELASKLDIIRAAILAPSAK